MSFWNGNNWVGDTSPPAAPAARPESRVRRIAAAALEASLITALTFGLIAGSAFAAKGGGASTGGGGRHGGGSTTGGGTISLAPLVVDNNGNGTPNFGDTVTFNVSTTATSQPYVNLVCGQGYDSWRGYFVGSLDSNWNFVLGSGGWSSGATDCTAWLGMYTKQGFQRLASTSFHVDP
jgi:hypothetical protein